MTLRSGGAFSWRVVSVRSLLYSFCFDGKISIRYRRNSQLWYRCRTHRRGCDVCSASVDSLFSVGPSWVRPSRNITCGWSVRVYFNNAPWDTNIIDRSGRSFMSHNRPSYPRSIQESVVSNVGVHWSSSFDVSHEKSQDGNVSMSSYLERRLPFCNQPLISRNGS